MISTRAFVISFVFVLVLQDSLEAGRLFAPRDTIGSNLKTEDRTVNNRLVICESQCRSEKQETSQFKKKDAQPSQLCIRECMNSKEDLVTTNMRIRRNVVTQQEKKENCMSPPRFLDHASVPATPKVDFSERKPNLSISWNPVYTDSWYNWTSYAIFYQAWNNQAFCRLVPKDQHNFIIANGEGWNYPSTIYIVIYTYPHSKDSPQDMKRYDVPPRPLPTFPPTSANVTTLRPSRWSIKYGFDITLKYVSISVGAIAGVLAITLAAVYHKRFIRICVQHWKSECGCPSDDPGPENYDHDVFMIFNGDDYTWVEERLLFLLEQQHQLRCRIHHRDFRAGGMIYDLMSDSVYRSYKNVVVYSWNFLRSGFCEYELNLAKKRLLSRNDDSLVIIRIDDADLGSLPEDLQTRSVIDYGSDRERTHWKRKLLEFLGVPHRYSHLRSTANNDTEVPILEPVNEEVIEN